MQANKETQDPGKIPARSPHKDRGGKNYLPMGIGLGLIFGTALGVALHNLVLWMPIGMSVGIVIAGAQAKKQNK